MPKFNHGELKLRDKDGDRLLVSNYDGEMYIRTYKAKTCDAGMVAMSRSKAVKLAKAILKEFE